VTAVIRPPVQGFVVKKNLSLVLGSVVLALLLCEAFLRIAGYRVVSFYSFSGFHQFDPELGWSQIPDHESGFKSSDFEVTARSNALGFRGDLYPYEKPDGIRRVVVLGDSYAWGWGVEQDEVFSEVAERLSRNTEWVNLGTSAFGTAQEYLLLRDRGMQFEPDRVVLAFYYNDILDNDGSDPKRPRFALEQGRLEQVGRPRPFSLADQIKTFLTRYSLLFHFLDYRTALLQERLKGLRARMRQGRADGDADTGAPVLPAPFYRNGPEETRRAWEVTEALLDRIDEVSGKRLLIVYVPDRIQVEWDNEMFPSAPGEGGPQVDLFLPNQRLREHAEARGIPFLDLTPAFREEHRRPGAPPLHFPTDGHWTPAGHALAGRLLVERVESLW